MGKVNFFKIILLAGDILITQAALFLALFLRNKQLPAQFATFSYHFFWVYCMWILLLFVLNLYDVHFFKKPVDFLFNVLIFSVVAFFLSTTYFYFFPGLVPGPKTILLLNIFIFSCLFFIWRFAIITFLQKVFAPLDNTDTSDGYESVNKKISLEHVNEQWFLEKISTQENRMYQVIKRFFDVVVGLVGLLWCIVLFPFIALAIKLDSPDTIFFHQKRTGKGGVIFTITKFRTMQENNSRQQELWREKNKHNITFSGKILRRLHLDELPQSWSMLKGDLSFVGPRPEWIELAKIFEKEIPFYRKRYLVKPGIIGWAQVNFRASQSLQEAKEKFEYDLYYIKNRSLLLDFEIILKAIKLFFW